MHHRHDILQFDRSRAGLPECDWVNANGQENIVYYIVYIDAIKLQFYNIFTTFTAFEKN
jgi:hypothetical protein